MMMKILLSSLLVYCFIFFSTASVAEDKYLLSETTYKSLNVIHELIAAEKNIQALNKIDSLLKSTSKPGYDKAIILQTKGYIYTNLEKYKPAAENFITALELNALPEDVTHQLRFNAGQLLIHTDQLKQGLKYLEPWFAKEKNPTIDNRLLLASAYYRLENYNAASKQLKLVIKQSKNPEESWYQMLLGCYFELKHYKSATSLLEKLVHIYPEEKTYWKQLTGLYQQRKLDKKALALTELMLTKGLLESDEKLRLSKLYLYHDMPYKSAYLLQQLLDTNEIDKSLEHYQLLTDAWQLAQENKNAKNALEKAASLSSDGNLYSRLGHILIELEDWPAAESALQRALELKKLDHLNRTQLLFGIASFQTGKLSQAKSALEKARTDKQLQEQADWWIHRIEDLTAEIDS